MKSGGDGVGFKIIVLIIVAFALAIIVYGDQGGGGHTG